MHILDDIKRPFNLLSTAIAVISLILSVYFYLESVQRREPYYLAKPTSQIVSKSVTSPNFTVVDGTGQKVVGDIHVLEIAFWNDGRLGIEPQDIRTPLYIQFPSGSRLLDTKIVRENKPSISNFRLSALQAPGGSGPRLGLSWTHLDPGVGARLQFIYVGEPNARLQFIGDILDAEVRDGAGPLNRLAIEWVRFVTAIALLIGAAVLPDVVRIRMSSSRSVWVRGAISIAKHFLIWSVLAFLAWLLFAAKSPPV